VAMETAGGLLFHSAVGEKFRIGDDVGCMERARPSRSHFMMAGLMELTGPKLRA
jgi:hypothetical protein